MTRPYVLTAIDKDMLRRLRIAQDDELTPAPQPDSSSSDDPHEPAEQ